MQLYTDNNKQEAAQAPIIKLCLTDEQFNKWMPAMVESFNINLINKLIDERLRDENQPYLKQKDFAEWIGESVATVNQLKAQGLPVASVLNSDRYGKQTYKDFMKQHETVKGF